MVSLSSCLIRQFYPSAECIWLCIRLNIAGLSGTALKKISILAIKKSSFQMKLILILAGTYAFGAQKTRVYWKADALKTSHLLVRILIQRYNWAIFLRKWARRGCYSQWRSLSGHVERIFEEEDIGNIWFQQDGATCHTAEATLYVLRPVFEDSLISLRAYVVWPQLFESN